MKYVVYGCVLLLGLWACGQTSETKTHNQEPKLQLKQTEIQSASLPLYQSSVFLSDATGKTVQISADSTSFDERLGESYRVLKVFKEIKGKEKELSRRLLPVNGSPDFRYQFADVYANDKNEWVVIQGHYFFFIYDVINDLLSEKIFPPKPKNFEAADAQSGRVTTLAFEGNQLKGTAQDIGPFRFSTRQLLRKMSR